MSGFYERRLERMLLEVVDQLCTEFPTVPLPVVVRTVEAARSVSRDRSSRDPGDAVAAIAAAARTDLYLLAEAVAEAAALP